MDEGTWGNVKEIVVVEVSEEAEGLGYKGGKIWK